MSRVKEKQKKQKQKERKTKREKEKKKKGGGFGNDQGRDVLVDGLIYRKSPTTARTQCLMVGWRKAGRMSCVKVGKSGFQDRREAERVKREAAEVEEERPKRKRTLLCPVPFMFASE